MSFDPRAWSEALRRYPAVRAPLRWLYRWLWMAPRRLRAARALRQAPLNAAPPPGPARADLGSCLCRQEHLQKDFYRYWCARLGQAPRYHRKQWEYVYVLQALWERGLLAPGRSGLGFGVGREPLAAVMAASGCRILATDQETSGRGAETWAGGGMLARGLHWYRTHSRLRGHSGTCKARQPEIRRRCRRHTRREWRCW